MNIRPLLFLFALVIAAWACQSNDSENYGKYTREEVRYYAYAPPLIPHPVLNPDCLDCHENGMVVDGYTAPVTPHPELVNCQQCHIRADESIKPFRENEFVGIDEPKTAMLTQPAGPPVIPHRVFMREDCLVCHNDSTRTEIIQTTHPERLNCTQCHVEQMPDAAGFKSRYEITSRAQ